MDNTNSNIPTGYISVDEALKLIAADSRDNPVVDITSAFRSIKYIRVDQGCGFTLRTYRKDANGNYEVGPDGYPVANGRVDVAITSKWDKDQLEHAVSLAYQKNSTAHRNYNTRSVTNVIDADTVRSAQTRINENPMIKENDTITGGIL